MSACVRSNISDGREITDCEIETFIAETNMPRRGQLAGQTFATPITISSIKLHCASVSPR